MVEDVKKLGGIVEIDETYVGGNDKNRHWHKKSGSRGRGDTGDTAVVGAVKRKGNVAARVVENTSRVTLEAFVRETVSNRVSLLCTDAYPGCLRLKHRFPHQSVDHTIGQHVVGAIQSKASGRS